MINLKLLAVREFYAFQFWFVECFSMEFYGLPSPSILSFQKDLQNTTELDHLFPKYVCFQLPNFIKLPTRYTIIIIQNKFLQFI